mgnify:CR=1 FL=1
MPISNSVLVSNSKVFPGVKNLSPGNTKDAAYNPFAHVPYLPQEGKQREFFECKADIIIFGGAVAAGKTLVLLAKMLEGTKTKNFVGTIFRRTATEVSAKGGLWDKARQYYGEIPGAISRDSTQYLDWRFPPGSSVNFAHSDNLFVSKLGAEMALIAVDELANDWTEEEFLFLLSRNRSNSGYPAQFVATCNPNCDSFLIKKEAKKDNFEDESENAWKRGSWLDWWIDDDGYPIPERSGVIRYFYRHNEELLWADSKEELLDKYPFIADAVPLQGTATAFDLIKSFTFISANVYDNPAFIDANPGYLANLLMLDEVDQKRFLGGNWKVSEKIGLIFNPANFQYVDPLEVPKDGVMIRFWDFAGTEEIKANPQSCYTASQKWKIVQIAKDTFDIYILNVFWEQTLDADSAIELAIEDGREVFVAWEQEGGSMALKYSSQLEKQFKQAVRGIQTVALKPHTDKVSRAKPWARLAKLGRVYIVRNSFWNGTLKNALIEFTVKSIPQVTDIIDAGSGCLQWYLEHYKKPSKPIAGTSKYKKVK